MTACNCKLGAVLRKDGEEWVVWIPPRLPEDYEGDALIGPAGDSYWPTLAEAVGFLHETMSDPRRVADHEGAVTK